MAPFSSLYSIRFCAICDESPDTYCNNEREAVLTSTPTWFTAVSTTNVSAF